MSRVLVVGSLNADLVVRTERFPGPGETVAGSDLTVGPGGKGANQAVAAARLGAAAGVAVGMVGAVGDDDHGRTVRDAVAAAGADVDGVTVRTGTATGTAVITVDAAGDNTIVVSPGANATLEPGDLPSFDDVAVLTLCLEIGVPTVLAAARAARAAGTTVVLNLSPYAPVPAELLAATDVLVVNEHEAALLGEHPVPRSVVTRGAAGCEVHDAGAATLSTVDAMRADVVDTTGSGDAFLAAVAVRLAAGDELPDAARYAVRAGALAVTVAGAQLPAIGDAERTRFGL
ncbi:ribokinase [Pseudonocardia sp. DR1-2]|uniref:ribokinase n=1 Tax=Pseudonocardia sp. DR1-2 TaxID=2951168 RepID=UPI002043C08B|nr:ribokinase [Pseudonocardia sp. DR1-2]MCM3847915.1 ribokinase [Pseudonocardia sp. DR1-2]